MNKNFTAQPATITSPYDRQLILSDLTRRGFSPVAYAVLSSMLFGYSRLDQVTVNVGGDIDRTAVVVTPAGRTTFQSFDGRWHDSAGIPLSAADHKVLDVEASRLVGYEG